MAAGWKTSLLALTLAALAAPAAGQNFTQSGAVVGGVAITADGLLRAGQAAATGPGPKRGAAAEAGRVYVSLPRVLAAWKAAREAGQAAPADVRFLQGLTRIDELFVYPADHDVVLAGPAEPVRADNAAEPVGTVTGRPVVQVEDLIVALRSLSAPAAGGRRDFFGCSLDPAPGSARAWEETMRKFSAGPRDRLLDELHKALGPQEVKLFGVPADSRVALVMVAADYRLKRMAMGIEPLPAGVGTALGTEAAMARLWFEPRYDPLRVSADGGRYEIRGPRLAVQAGAHVFEAGGAGPAQTAFAARLSAKMTEVAPRVDAVADLQNVTDCFLVAAVLRRDGLIEKAGLDLGWLADAAKYPVTALPAPRTADTLVHVSGNMIVQGGVALSYKALAATARDAAPAAGGDAPRPTSTWFVSVKPTGGRP